MTELIVDFPTQRCQCNRHNHHRHRGVRFADFVETYIVERHEDYEESKVTRHDLWYTGLEYRLMKLSVKKDVLKVRARALARIPFNYSGNDEDDGDNDDVSNEENSICCIGIEHLLTSASIFEVNECRARCIRAVLSEQSRQGPSSKFRWEAIAFASLAETRRAAMRARRLGFFHQDSI